MADFKSKIISTFGTQRFTDPETGWAARITKDMLFIDAKAGGKLAGELWKVERLFVGLGFFKAPRPTAVASVPPEAPEQLLVAAEAIPEVPAIARRLELLTRYVNTTPVKRPIDGSQAEEVAAEPEPALPETIPAQQAIDLPITDPPITEKPVLLVDYPGTIPTKKAKHESVLSGQRAEPEIPRTRKRSRKPRKAKA